MGMDDSTDIFDKLEAAGLFAGRMISHSKSFYRSKYNKHEVYFNANIFTAAGKVWWGDIDLTVSGAILQGIADDTGETLYVLRELDGRFENEGRSGEEAAKYAVKTYAPSAKEPKTVFDVIDKGIPKKKKSK